MKISELYGRDEAGYQSERYKKAAEALDSAANFYSAPGRAEIGGNHTDHQRGRVLACAVTADIICAAVKSERMELTTETYEGLSFDLLPNAPEDCKPGTSEALVRGVLDYFSVKGYKTGGIRGHIHSEVPEGSGLSSSAAFTNLIGTALNHEYNGGKIPPLEIAKAGRHAENRFFGKPSGLMDQAASALGGFVYIDFLEDEPLIENISFSPEEHGLDCCIVHTGGSHANLTEDYAAITVEMLSAADFLGKKFLGLCNISDFYEKIPDLRRLLGDRAVLRAIHFFNETERAKNQATALKKRDLDEFLRLVDESGQSSISCLQNIYTTENPAEQPVSLALALARQAMAGTPRGVCRVHGGGFAGTILCFLPREDYGAFRRGMERVFGEGSCRRLSIRQAGAVRVDMTANSVNRNV